MDRGHRAFIEDVLATLLLQTFLISRPEQSEGISPIPATRRARPSLLASISYMSSHHHDYYLHQLLCISGSAALICLSISIAYVVSGNAASIYCMQLDVPVLHCSSAVDVTKYHLILEVEARRVSSQAAMSINSIFLDHPLSLLRGNITIWPALPCLRQWTCCWSAPPLDFIPGTNHTTLLAETGIS